MPSRLEGKQQVSRLGATCGVRCGVAGDAVRRVRRYDGCGAAVRCVVRQLYVQASEVRAGSRQTKLNSAGEGNRSAVGGVRRRSSLQRSSSAGNGFRLHQLPSATKLFFQITSFLNYLLNLVNYYAEDFFICSPPRASSGYLSNLID
ncbi:hypothetical protein R6Q59_014181 [Mikania micrantha]